MKSMNRRLHVVGLVALVASLALLCSPASAAVVVFSGVDVGAGSANPRPNSDSAAASFDVAASALGSLSLIDFESAPLGSFSNLLVAPGVTINGTDHSGNNQTILNAPYNTPDRLYGYNVTSGGSQFASLYGGSLTFSFADPTSAFGTYYSGGQLSTAQLQFSDGSSQTVAIPNASGGIVFIGFTDVGKFISSVTVSGINDIVAVDDVRYIGGPVVPEPSTFIIWSLLGAVGITIGWRRRRRVA
jgi:hypothetical protein